MQQKNLPIGYWIKKADTLLTQEIKDIQSCFGLTRTEWQVLNSIREKGRIGTTEIASLLRPFAEELKVGLILKKFKENGILTEDQEQLLLTEKGNLLHTHCFEEQQAFRKKMMKNISDEAYEQTIATLQQIIDNLSQ